MAKADSLLDAQALELLRHYWRYPAFRPVQAEIIADVLVGKDVLALLPTGGGKSLCFQIPALVKPGLCLVISPLIALMIDQTERLRNMGIRALAIHSGLRDHEQGAIFQACLDEIDYPVKLLYLSPERLKSPIVRERLSMMDINLIAIDEAHCISDWGHNFRPAYRQLAELRSYVKPCPWLALTATATPQVADDIRTQLGFGKSTALHIGNFARDGLSLSAFRLDEKMPKLLSVLRGVDGAAIVYARSRKGVERCAQALQKAGISADFVHAGLTVKERTKRQQAWLQNRSRVMVATTVFGMGIDKADVRAVIHIDVPESLEAYYQEVGRAGRDGKKAYGVLLYSEADLNRAKHLIEESYPDERFIRSVYAALCNHYQLALHEGEGMAAPFDQDRFGQLFNLPLRPLTGALSRLEAAGLIERNEGIAQTGKVRILLDATGLYDYQLRNRSKEALLKTMLRLYGGGLFTDDFTISESRLGTSLGQDAIVTERQLQSLANDGVIAYTPPSDKAQITFLTGRYIEQDLPLAIYKFSEQKQRQLAKAVAMANQAAEPKVCRMVRLVGYFGQAMEKPCQICDNCLMAKKPSKTIDWALINRILQASGSPIAVAELPNKILDYKPDEVIAAVRQMISLGQLKLKDGLVYPSDI